MQYITNIKSASCRLTSHEPNEKNASTIINSFKVNRYKLFALLCASCFSFGILQAHSHHSYDSNVSKNNVNLSQAINILGNWRINIIEKQGVFVRVPQEAEGAEIQINNNQITGIAGCNRFMTTYVRQSPTQINVNEGAVTKKMCSSQAMQFEDTFLQIFTGTFIIEKSFDGISLVRDDIKIRLIR